MPERVKVDGGDAAAGKIFLKNILIPARLHGDILLSCKKIGILFRHSFQRSQKRQEKGGKRNLSPGGCRFGCIHMQHRFFIGGMGLDLWSFDAGGLSYAHG